MTDSNFDIIKEKIKGRKAKSKICVNCNAEFHKLRDLLRHEKNRKNIACLHCNRQFCNNEHFQKHLRTINRKTNSVIDYEMSINPKSGYEDDPEFQNLLEEKKSEIEDSETLLNNYKIINKEIDPDFMYGDLDTLLTDIYSREKSSFKINLGFGFALHNIVTGEYRYHYVSSNTLLFEHAITISNQHDLDKFLKKVFELDLATNYYLRKPSSSWILAALTNIVVFIYELKDVPIGRPPIDLPNYIKHSMSIVSLTRDANNKPFKDDRCFFRCLSLHHSNKIRGLEKATKRLKKQLEAQTGLSYENGVQIHHIPDIERIFEVNVNIYSLNEDGQADVIYLSRLKFTPMHVNLYKNHFSYIKNFNTFAKRFACQMCETIFDRADNLNTHVKICCTEQEEVFIGGKHKKDRTVFERLELAGYDIAREDRYCPYISCFDFEALQVPRNERLKGRNIVYKHIPATFSVHSNVPGHTEVQHRVSDGNPQRLVDELITILLRHQDTASTEMNKRFETLFTELDEDLQDIKEKLETPGDPKDQKYNEKCQKKLQTLKASLEKYCNQHIILSFNGSRYDLPLIKRYLASSLKRLDKLPPQIISKDRNYMVIATDRLKFLDLLNYLAAGTSLANFYKAYNVKNPKASFPYQWFDSLTKLGARYLPIREEFYSLLTNTNISEEEYQTCIDAWCLHGWETFGEYVKYYNDLDVTGMTEAVIKMLKIYNEKDLDLFKDAISLAGITQKYVFKNLHKDIYFSNFGYEHSYIYKDLRQKGICGGPSICFTRYHEAGVTKIRGGKVCKNIIGLDCNSMYLNCTAMPMATGWYSLREKKDDYKRQTRYSNESIQWLTHISKERNIAIRHEENSPLGEKRIENYKVDGFCEETQTVFEYNGCYHHGHDCSNNYNAEKWGRTLQKEEALRNIGYHVESITSCEWRNDDRSNIWYDTENVSCTMQDVITGVNSDEIFGFVKLSIKVPEELIPKYSEFPPIFKNVEIKLEDIGDVMQKFCKDTNRTTGVKRSLISSMFGDEIVISTVLMKKYLEMGLIVTDIEWILEYDPQTCFKWFQDDVIHDRR